MLTEPAAGPPGPGPGRDSSRTRRPRAAQAAAAGGGRCSARPGWHPSAGPAGGPTSAGRRCAGKLTTEEMIFKQLRRVVFTGNLSFKSQSQCPPDTEYRGYSESGLGPGPIGIRDRDAD